MKNNDQRRKTRRYPVKWKAAMVFDRAANKPIVHTQTLDISAGGVGIHSEHGDLTGTMVTLLLAQPSMLPGDAPKMMKVRARVVCTFQTPGTAGYRHGLSFERMPGDGLDDLETLLQLHAPAEALAEVQAPAASPAVAAQAATAQAAQPAVAQQAAQAAVAQQAAQAASAQASPTASMAPGGRLAALRAAAAAKAAEPPKADPQEEINQNVSGALERVFGFFKEMVEEMNKVNAPYPSRGYAIAGVPDFSDFCWEAGYMTFQTKEISLSKKLWTRARLDFRIAKPGPPLKVVRDFPASEKLTQVLKELKIEFTTKAEKNERGAPIRTTFTFPAEVKASANFEGNFETGKLLLTMRNIGSYGMMEYVVNPLSVTPEALDELLGFLLAETKKVGPILENA